MSKPALKKKLSQAEIRRKLSPSEAAIQKACLELLDLLDIPYSVTDAALSVCACGAVRRSKVKKSWPDVTACLPPNGRLLVLEVKTEGGDYRPGQPEMLESLRAAGALVVVPRSVEDLERVLRQAGVMKTRR